LAESGAPYNDTPVSIEDEVDFVDGVSFDSKAAVYLAEAQALADTRTDLYSAISEGLLSAEDLTSPYALEDIHLACYGSVWKWAGKLRVREVSIGAAPENIRDLLYGELQTLDWQVENLDKIDLTPEFVAMCAHHHLVKIHPFVDGNGRVTRLFADVLLLAMTGNRIFEWTDSPDYFAALRRADQTMNPEELLSVVGVIDLA
jgi:fido (protein-threonine AMPylation protein)